MKFKIIALTSLVLVLISCLLSAAVGIRHPLNTVSADIPETDASELSSETLTENSAQPSASADEQTILSFFNGTDVVPVTMRDYLIGAVAAEMPALFDEEALKAQAVASRTYVMYRMNAESNSSHPDADICCDSTCCMAWKDDGYLREKWGEKYAEYSEKITSAVEATDGEYLTYNGAAALTAFHSSSPGRTEASGDVWGTQLPYLTNVESPETASDVPNYITAVTVAKSDFTETVKRRYPAADFSGSDDTWIGKTVRTAGGRIETVDLGGVSVPGTALRSMFELRSADIELEINENDVVFTVTGYGHGVGMSQFGANVMAEQGKSCAEILSWYYPGTVLVSDI